MNSKEVELTSGRTVKVYVPPILRIRSILEKKYPMPKKKVVTSDTIGGGTVSMVIEDDPEYAIAVAEREELIDEESQELTILFALKRETVPEDFDMDDYLSILSYSNPDVKPRPGIQGRKLDWIEWELLANPADRGRVQVAINDLISVDLEAVDLIEQSFPDNVEEGTS